jgi:outer membrane protein assembly factor BamA
LSAGTRVGLLNTTLAGGTDSRFPSIESIFVESTAPGFDTQPDYLYTEVFADVDTRDEAGNPRSGTHHRVSWVRYDDDVGAFSFSRLTAEANHFFPVFDKKRVFLVRGKVILSEPGADNTVPFFLMSTLGGSHSLRSHADYRFRDSNVLVFNAEYQWEAFSNLDMAVFADAGTVWSDRSKLDLGSLKTAYGLGLRFNTSTDVFYRIDIAHGEHGFQFLFKFSGPFKDRGTWPDDTRSHRHRSLP